VDFDLMAGEVHALVGENGAGKSTLVKILSGAYQPDSGALMVDGQAVRMRRAEDAERLGIATIHQEIILVPALDVASNILLGNPPLTGGPLIRALGIIDRNRLYEAAQTALSGMHIAINPRGRAGDLGVSAAQLVLIARGLLRSMKILILDEPTAALTPQERDELFIKLRALRMTGVGIVYVSHRLDEVMELADRLTVLRDGSAITTLETSAATIDQVVELMLARPLDEMYPERNRRPGSDVLLQVKDVSRKGRVEQPSIRDISFTVKPGEVVGITGLVGAGKTELARAICGVDAIDDGEVAVLTEGHAARIRSPQDAIRAGIALVPEDRKTQGLVLLMNLVENVAITMANSGTTRPLVTWFGQVLRWQHLAEIARALIKRFQIKVRNPGQMARDLSGGNQQKLVIAKSLETRPKIVVLDEPTRGIAIGSKAEIYAIVERLVRDGLGVVMVSSEIEEILRMSDRILVMRKGTIVKEFDQGAATSEAILRYAAAGQ
jgi:ABC-type sugar transport system ATPase subunit